MFELIYELHHIQLLIYFTYLLAPLLIVAGAVLLSSTFRKKQYTYVTTRLLQSKEVNLTLEYTQNKISFIDWLVKQIRQLIKSDDDEAYFSPIYQ